MRKSLILLMAATLTLAFATVTTGCSSSNSQPKSIPLETDFEITMSSSSSNLTEPDELFGAPLNTNASASESAGHLPTFKISSVTELEQLELLYTEVRGWGDKAEGHPLFDEVTAKYDEAFFEENSLIVSFFSAGSGSYDYGVESVECKDGKLLVRIMLINIPSEDVSYTCDVAGWLVAVAVPNSMIENCTYFDAVKANDLALLSDNTISWPN